MAQKSQSADQFIDLPFPTSGLNTSTDFAEQVPGTTPSGTNVRGYEPNTDRNRGGSRPGLVKYLDAQANGVSVIQHLNVIVDPQAGALLSDNTIEFSPDGPPPPVGGGGIPGSGILDPSTNNLSSRNPGRYVRNGGSGRQPIKGGFVTNGYFYVTTVTIGDGNFTVETQDVNGTIGSYFTNGVPAGYPSVGTWVYQTGTGPDYVWVDAPQPKNPGSAISFSASAYVQGGATVTFAPTSAGAILATINIDGTDYPSSLSPAAVTGLAPGTSYQVVGFNTSFTAGVDPVRSTSDLNENVGELLTLPEVFSSPSIEELRPFSFIAYMASPPAGADRNKFRLYDSDGTTPIATDVVNGTALQYGDLLPGYTYYVGVASGNASGFAGFGTLTQVITPGV